MEHLGSAVVKEMKSALDNLVKEIKQLEEENDKNKLYKAHIQQEITDRIKKASE